MKVCSKCGIEKDLVEFSKSNDKKDGLRSQCKACFKLYQQANKEQINKHSKTWREANKEKTKAYYEANKENKKTYREANKEKIKTYYEANKEKQNERHKTYREANKEKIKAYREANKEKLKEQQKAWHKANKEQVKERQKAYREINKEKLKEKNDSWYKANKEQIKEQKKAYRKANKEKIREQRKYYTQVNKEKIRAYGETKAKYKTYSDRLEIYDEAKEGKDGCIKTMCAYCGTWIYPTIKQVKNRLAACESPNASGEQRIYCNNSDTGEGCREACPTYYAKLYPKDFKSATSREVIPLVRHMVFKRDNYTCQHCSKTIQTTQIHAHHIEGVAHYPMLQNDISNIITLCKKCHKALHKQNGCEYKDYKCA